jgi:AcrR family transcriptional regulator
MQNSLKCKKIVRLRVMTTQPGLRELKKQRTHSAISDAAIALFLERGFENVSITQIAEAAEVSRRTLFAYFPTKEDLVVHRIADHETEAARVVRARPGDVTPLAALREHFLDGLRRRDPVTGLNDHPEIGAFYRLILDTPDLIARQERFRSTGERTLGLALQETAGLAGVTARLAAAQLIAVQWTLARDNIARLAAGESADERYPVAVQDAEHAYSLLRDGLGDLTPRR